ncbi:MAG: MFS transporter [Pirellulales bacterium]|nr:MFS transporter [Pirellulales bacterium]
MSELNGFQHTFRALRHRNFGLFFAGHGISMVGTWMQQIAISWLVYRLTHSAFLLGMVGFCNQFPAFLLASFAGVFVDRWNRHRIILATQTLSMIQALLLAVLTLMGIVSVWHVIILGMFLGVIHAIDMPARQSFLVDMVEKKEDLINAIALNSSLVNAARLIGPTLAGLLVASFGEGWCFLINGLSFIAVIVALFLMKINSPKKLVSNANIWSVWKEGILYAYKFTPIGAILLLLSLVSLVGMSYVVLMPIFATSIFHGGPRTLGFLVGASGLGALTGTLYLASRKNAVGLCRVIAISAGLFGVGLIIFGCSDILWVSLIIMLMTGFGMIVEMASSNTVLQTIVDDDKRGRVMSLFAMAFFGMAPLGSLLAGILAHHLGAPATVMLGGSCCIIGAILFSRKLPAIHQKIHPIYVRMGILSDLPADI